MQNQTLVQHQISSPSAGASASLITNLSGGASVNMCPTCNTVTMLARCANCGTMTVSIRAAPERPTTTTRVPPPPPPATIQNIQHEYESQYHQQNHHQQQNPLVTIHQTPHVSPSVNTTNLHHQHHHQHQSQAQQLRGEVEEFIRSSSAQQQQQQQQYQAPYVHTHNPGSNPTTPRQQHNHHQDPTTNFDRHNNNENTNNTSYYHHQHHHHGNISSNQQQNTSSTTTATRTTISQHQQQHQQQSRALQHQDSLRSTINQRSNNNNPNASPNSTFSSSLRDDLETFPQRLEIELEKFQKRELELQNIIQELQRTKFTLETENTTITNELSLSRDETRFAKEEQSRIQKRLEQETERLKSKSEELMRLQTEVADLQGNNDLAEIEHKAARDEAFQFKQKLSDEVKRSESLKTRMQEEIDRLRNELNSTESRYEKRFDDLTRRHQEEAKEKAELVTKLRKFESDTHSIRSEFEQELISEKFSKDKKINQLKEELQRAEDEASTARLRNGALDEQLQSTKKELASTEEVLRDTRRKLSEMSNEHLALRAEFDTKLAEQLATQADDVNKERRDMKYMVDDARGREEIAVNRLADLEKEVSGLRDSLAKAATLERELRAKLAKEKEKAAHESGLTDQAKEHSQKMQDMLNQELARQRDRANNLEEEFNAYKRNHDEEIGRLKHDKERLEKENTEYRKFTVSRDLEAELKAKLAQTETERDEAIKKRDEAVSVIDALKKDREDARKLAEAHELECERAKEILREIANHFDIPGASVLSIETAVKTLIPKSEEIITIYRKSTANQDHLQEIVESQKKELEKMADDLHRTRCDVEAEKRYVIDIQERCDQSVSVAEQRVRSLMQQIESERGIARDDIDTMIASYDQQLESLRQEKERIATELKNAFLQIDHEKESIAVLVKEKETLSRNRDDLQKELVPLRQEKEDLRSKLQSTQADLEITREKASHEQEERVKLVKQLTTFKDTEAEFKIRETHLQTRYEQEIEGLRKALRNERAKVLREIDMTHAAHGRALLAQEQLDSIRTETETQSVRRRFYDEENNLILNNSNNNNNNNNSSSTTSIRGQGLTLSPSSNWHRTTIVPSSSSENHHQQHQHQQQNQMLNTSTHSFKMHSPGSSIAPSPENYHQYRRGEQLSDVTIYHNNININKSSATGDNENNNNNNHRSISQEAAQWRETRIMQNPTFVRGEEHSSGQVPPANRDHQQYRISITTTGDATTDATSTGNYNSSNQNNNNDNTSNIMVTNRGRSGSGGGSGVSRSVPLSQFRRV